MLDNEQEQNYFLKFLHSNKISVASCYTGIASRTVQPAAHGTLRTVASCESAKPNIATPEL